MKIEHIAMYVNDLEAAKDFFVRIPTCTRDLINLNLAKLITIFQISDDFKAELKQLPHFSSKQKWRLSCKKVLVRVVQ